MGLHLVSTVALRRRKAVRGRVCSIATSPRHGTTPPHSTPEQPLSRKSTPQAERRENAAARPERCVCTSVSRLPTPLRPSLMPSRSAREIIDDEMGVPTYKPVVDAEDDAAASASNSVATGYRRARAG